MIRVILMFEGKESREVEARARGLVRTGRSITPAFAKRVVTSLLTLYDSSISCMRCSVSG